MENKKVTINLVIFNTKEQVIYGIKNIEAYDYGEEFPIKTEIEKVYELCSKLSKYYNCHITIKIEEA